jgi:hypothetical protein
MDDRGRSVETRKRAVVDSFSERMKEPLQRKVSWQTKAVEALAQGFVRKRSGDSVADADTFMGKHGVLTPCIATGEHSTPA